MNKIDRALEIAKTDGVGQLARSATSYSTRILYQKFLDLYLSGNIMERPELMEYCTDQGQPWISEIQPLRTYKPNMDRISDPTDFDKCGKGCTPDQSFVCNVQDATLVGSGAVGFSDHGKLILETAGGSREQLLSRYDDFLGTNTIENVISTRASGGTQRPSGSLEYVFPLVPFYNQYYYHWLLIYLPKTRMLRRYEQKTNNKPTILIPNNPPSFVIDSLLLLGYDSHRFIEWDREKKRVDNLIISSHKIHSTKLNRFEQSRDDYEWLRREMEELIEYDPSLERRIYISRQKAKRGRCVENYDKVSRELKSRGFERVIMESLPIKEQIRIMLEADVIMGPHGAGLANMVFADNPTVIELFPDNMVKPPFYMLCDSLGFEYENLVSKSKENKNLQVDLEELRNLLDKVGL